MPVAHVTLSEQSVGFLIELNRRLNRTGQANCLIFKNSNSFVCQLILASCSTGELLAHCTLLSGLYDTAH